MDTVRLQSSTYITKRAVLQGIHQVSHPNSYSCQDVSGKIPTKGTPNFCCEATVFFIFPPTRVRHKKQLGCSHLHPIGQLTYTRRPDGGPDPDGVLKVVVRIKILHCRNICLNRPDPITLLPLAVDTSDRLYDDFIRLFFLHTHREASAFCNELPEKSDQFRFLRSVYLANLKGSGV